jgi:hypothetical protein
MARMKPIRKVRDGVAPEVFQSPEGITTAQAKAARVVVMIGFVLILPIAATLSAVRRPGVFSLEGASTPHGYTWSLLLFLVPLAVLGVWFQRRKDLKLQRRALWRATPILASLGFSLDFLFGSKILRFDNLQATLGILVPVLGGQDVPVEEFVFYLSGFLVVLLTYLWCDEAWLARYNEVDYSAGVARVHRLVHFHWPSLVVGVAIWGLAIIYRLAVVKAAGFPLYFTFLLAVSIIPSMGFFHSVCPYINWRGFSFTLLLMLLVSVVWEVTLALPYQWWGYREEAMLGVPIGAWSSLPLEAVLVWVAVTYTSVIIYEVIKIWQASGESARSAFLAIGKPQDRSGEVRRL